METISSRIQDIAFAPPASKYPERRKETTMQLFTPQNTALLLIDHQVGTMQLIKNIDRNLAAKQAVALAKMAKILGIPTILTSSQEDRAQGPLLPELASILPDAYGARIKRPGVVNAWAYPAFKAAVVATGRKNLIMAGVTTDVCLSSQRSTPRRRVTGCRP
jgi:nicotinamidase-related amidase